MQVIECRNTEQIREDDLLKAHTEILSLLNDVIPGVGCTYRGEQRELMVKFRDRLAQAIEVGDATPPARWSMFNTPWSVMLRYTVWGYPMKVLVKSTSWRARLAMGIPMWLAPPSLFGVYGARVEYDTTSFVHIVFGKP